jgi:hypothetical protein
MYLLLKHIECDDRPYLRLLQYTSVCLVKSYLYIFWLFRLLPILPPTRYRSPLGIAIDLWNSGILKEILSSIALKLTSVLSRSRKFRTFLSFWKKCRYFCPLDSLKVFMPMMLFFWRLDVLDDLREAVERLRSS